MPTYEYECLSCGSNFDAFQKMSESALEKCVNCQGSVRRVVSGGSGVIFKGSGFYITDYGKQKSSSDKSQSTSGSQKKDSAPKSTKSSSKS